MYMYTCMMYIMYMYMYIGGSYMYHERLLYTYDLHVICSYVVVLSTSRI